MNAKWMALVFLVASWVLWLAARFAGQDGFSGWAFVVSYVGLAAGLILAASVGGALRQSLQLFGAGFAMLALGELGWLTLYADGGTGGSVILPNLPYVAANVLFLVAAVRIYLNGQNIFGFAPVWLWLSVAVGLVGGVLLSVAAFDPAAGLSAGFWVDAFNSVSGAFVTALMLSLAVLTLGGSWSQWMIPLAAGFFLRMVGDVYYTLTADTYVYGSPADWLWLLGSAAISFLLIRSEQETGAQPALS